jgi:putative CocE/NonD family hydrolase
VVTAADGTRLLVDHLHPGPEPDLPARAVVWIRTPYGRRGLRGIARRFARRDVHVLVEALRGTDGSGGEFDDFSLDPADAAAVADWAAGRPWFAGPLVTWGASAVGRASWALAGCDVPAWRLALLQDSSTGFGDVTRPGGAMAPEVALGYAASIDWLARHPGASALRSLVGAVRAAWRIRRVLDDLPLGRADLRLVGRRSAFYQRVLDDARLDLPDLRAGAAGMPAQVHLATGWFDACLAGALRDHRALRDAGRAVRLVIGPWYHGRGTVDRAYTDDVDAALDALVRDGSAFPGSSVRVHVGGADEWRELADWPPPGTAARAWHLHAGGRLAPEPAPPADPDRFRYDPADPTPAVGGAAEPWLGGAGPKDNRVLERRPDVLTWTGERLTTDVEIIGSVEARIFLRSSGEHADLFVRSATSPRGVARRPCATASVGCRPGTPPRLRTGPGRCGWTWLVPPTGSGPDTGSGSW